MAKRTGKDLAMLIGGTALAVARNASYEEEDVDVDSTAAGESWIDRDSLRGDFTVETDGLVEIASPYVLTGQASRGSKVAFSMKLVTGDTNGIVSGTAKVSRIRLTGAYDGLWTWSVTLRCAGTAPTWDLTPA